MGGGDDERWRAGLVDDDEFGDPELPHGECLVGGAEADGVGGRREDVLGKVVGEQGGMEVDNPTPVAGAQGLQGGDVGRPPGGDGKGGGRVERLGVGASRDGEEGPLEEAAVGQVEMKKRENLQKWRWKRG